MSKTPWRLKSEELATCNCDWGCPCQFNANPTDGDCHGASPVLVTSGRYGGSRQNANQILGARSFKVGAEVLNAAAQP